jgi:acyl carrier protein
MEKIILEILENIRPECEFNNSNDFVEDDMLDSLDLIQLFDELETKFDIEIDSDEFNPENFVSIETIKDLVNRTKNG